MSEDGGDLPADAPDNLALSKHEERKVDLSKEDRDRAMSFEEGQLLARMIGAEAFIQTSAADRYTKMNIQVKLHFTPDKRRNGGAFGSFGIRTGSSSVPYLSYQEQSYLGPAPDRPLHNF